MRRWLLVLGGGLTLLLAACGAADEPVPPPEPDRVATRVAEEQAVAATLTAAAPAAPTTAASATATRSAPPTQAPSPTPAEPGDATATPLPATATAPPPTATAPPATATSPPSRPPQFANIAFIPDPSARRFGGGVILPGVPFDNLDTPTFGNQLVLQVVAFYPPEANQDGVGITNVTFIIEDEGGDEVYRHTENQAGYCLFGGGEPACNVWDFAANNCQWPDGAPVTSGPHRGTAQINRVGDSQAWSFDFRIDLSGSPCGSRPPQFANVFFSPDPSARTVGGGVQAAVSRFDADDTPVVTDPLLLRVIAYLPSESNPDGSPVESLDGRGLQSVTFTVFSPSAIEVYEHTERFAPYCLFNGDNNVTCPPFWRFAEHSCRWPTGDLSTESAFPVEEGPHQVTITITGEDGRIEEWFTSFFLDLPDGSPCAP